MIGRSKFSRSTTSRTHSFGSPAARIPFLRNTRINAARENPARTTIREPVENKGFRSPDHPITGSPDHPMMRSPDIIVGVGSRIGRSLPTTNAGLYRAAWPGRGKSELRRAVCRITSGRPGSGPVGVQETPDETENRIDGKCHRKHTAPAGPAALRRQRPRGKAKRPRRRRRLRGAQHAQGQETPAQQGDRRYSYVCETHKDRLSTLLVRVAVCSFVIRRRPADGWARVLISAARLYMHRPSQDHGAVGPGPADGIPSSPIGPRQPGSDGSRAGSVPRVHVLVPVADGSAGDATGRFA